MHRRFPFLLFPIEGIQDIQSGDASPHSKKRIEPPKRLSWRLCLVVVGCAANSRRRAARPKNYFFLAAFFADFFAAFFGAAFLAAFLAISTSSSKKRFWGEFHLAGFQLPLSRRARPHNQLSTTSVSYRLLNASHS
jgi:hypothetical protein